MICVRLPILTFLYLFFLHYSILTFAAHFPTSDSPADNHYSNNDLVSPDSMHSTPKPQKLALAFGRGNTIATVVIILISLLNIIVYRLRQFLEAKISENLNKSSEQLCRRFSFSEIQSATHNFDDKLVIGRGGFGMVYKGFIDNGAITVAIKRLNPTSKQGATEFWTEIDMLSKIRHSHIVSLIGYCNNWGEMILVYEYMVRGSLADHLHKIGKNGNNLTLSWVQRLKICSGAARGLEYLHSGTGVKNRVIHRDVKSSNILLDENWAAKISDFGLSKIGPADQPCTHVSTNVKGTFGYLDMEYFLTRRLTRKSDVYAFGVVLFEVLCGRPAVDLRLEAEQRGLAGWAQHCIKEGTLDRIIDPLLMGQMLPESLMAFEQIANQCLHMFSKKRPTMAEVVVSLERTLALQEITDSSTLEWEIFNTGGTHNNPENADSSMEQNEVTNVGNGGNEEQINGIRQLADVSNGLEQFDKNADSHTKQQKVINEQIDSIMLLGDANSKLSPVKPARTMAFTRKLRLFFLGTERVNLVHSDAKPSKSSKSNNDTGGNSTLPNKDGDVHKVPRSCQVVNQNLKIFTFDELKTATENFRSNMLLGKGGFGEVFIGWVDDKTYTPSKVGVGMAIFVKKFIPKFFLGFIEWQSEMRMLGKFSHPNLVNILGYCSENEAFLLVSEYMQKGSLENHLFKIAVAEDAKPLPWVTRLKIAIGAARGLAFLHTTEKQVIYRQFKTCNILLDWDFNAKLLNFGHTKLDQVNCYSYPDSYVSTFVTPNFYAAPEYYATGHMNAKNDVYCFGMVLLEILAGRRAPNVIHLVIGKNYVLNRVRPFLLDKRKLKTLVDPWLEDAYTPEGAFQFALLIVKCLEYNPDNRPSMEEVLDTLEHINAESGRESYRCSDFTAEPLWLGGDDLLEKWEGSETVETLRYAMEEMELSGPR